MAEPEEGNIWLAIVAGWIVMIILNIWLPVLGPVIGGFVAGWIARGGTWNGAKAGLLAGVLGWIVLSVMILIGASFFLGGVGFLVGLGTGLVLIAAAFLYTGVLGLIGGAIAGAIRS